jgi:hypothetical protein
MIRRVAVLFVVCGLLTAAGCKAEFREYTNAAGKYKVQFPGTPKEQTQNVPGGGTAKIAGLDERNGAYMVMFSDMPIPPNEPQAKIDNRLEGAIQGMMQNNGGTVTSKENIMANGKYPGREVQGNITRPIAGILRCKIILVGTRMYQVMVLGNPSFANSADATKFLTSFTITD